jgi:hypothetical protein
VGEGGTLTCAPSADAVTGNGHSEALEPMFEPFYQAKVSVNGQAAFGDTPGGRNPAIEEKQIRFCVAVERHVRLGCCRGAHLKRISLFGPQARFRGAQARGVVNPNSR